jgi:hypothetical protein
LNILNGFKNEMVYKEIDKLLAEIEDENLNELNNSIKIINN